MRRSTKRYIKKIGKNIFLFFKYFYYQLFGKKQCPVCGAKIIKFDHLPMQYLDALYQHRFLHSIFSFETCNFTEYSCPFCQTNDSFRLYALYLKKALSEIKEKIDFVEFAPVPAITKIIKSFPSVNYRSADLFDQNVDDKVDLVDLKIYGDNSKDMFICTHVLEHISEDQKAINELYRILKPGREAIIQVPILLSLDKDYENEKLTSEEDCWKHFGERDHKRLYSRQGFIGKLELAGFKVSELGKNYFGEEIFNKCGLADSAVLYIVKK